MQKSNYLKLAIVAGLVLMAAATLFGYHVPVEAASLGFFAIGDTENVGAELKQLLTKQGENFEAFKKANDALLAAKAEGRAVADLEAKLAKIDGEFVQLTKDMGEIAKKANRPTAGASELTTEQAEHKSRHGLPRDCH